MTTKSPLTPKTHKQALNKKLSDVRKEMRLLKKQESSIREQRDLEKDMSGWQTIMDVRSACEKLVREAKIGKRYTLSKIAKHPTFYIYQHPHKRELRSSNINADWVQKYIGNKSPGPGGGRTGSIEDLLETARVSTLRTWKRLNKKDVKKGRTPYLSKKDVLTSSRPSERIIRHLAGKGKAKAIGSVGVG